MLTYFDANDAGTDYVIGDIHGCHDQLMGALRCAGFDHERDRLFSVGDLIDRGPNSLGCLRLPYEPWFHAVRGNHEELAFKALNSGSRRDMDLWLLNGGDWIHGERLPAVRALLDDVMMRMPHAFEIEVAGARVGIVHAEPPRDWRLVETADKTLDRDMIWSRRRIGRHDKSLVRGIDLVVVGHTIVEAPCCLGNVRYIDTGAFATKQGGYLTLERLDDLVAEARLS